MHAESPSELAARVWGKNYDRHGADYHGPTPGHSRRDRGTIIRPRADGRGVFVFSFNADWRETREAFGLARDDRPLTAQDRRAFAKAKAEHERQRQEEARIKRVCCAALWAETIPLAPETAAFRYLTIKRGIPAEVVQEAADAGALRFHPAAPLKPYEPDGRTMPALMAIIRNAQGEASGLHLTYVKPDGSDKAFGDRSRVMLGQAGGGAIRLAQAGDAVAISEGIETGLAFRALFGVPTWAAAMKWNLANFSPPDGVSRVVIAADGDKPGLEAADIAFERLQADYAVQLTPAPAGKDWANIHDERRAA